MSGNYWNQPGVPRTCYTAPPKARYRCMRQRNGFAFDARAVMYAMLG